MLLFYMILAVSLGFVAATNLQATYDDPNEEPTEVISNQREDQELADSYRQSSPYSWNYYWKQKEKQQPPQCAQNETYSTCYSECGLSCSDFATNQVNCPNECKVGCTCNSGYVRDPTTGSCVLPVDCQIYPPRCPPGQVFYTCGDCPASCLNPYPICPRVCRTGICGCPKGQIRVGPTSCAPIDELPCGKIQQQVQQQGQHQQQQYMGYANQVGNTY